MIILGNANLVTVQNLGEIPRQEALDFLNSQPDNTVVEVQNPDGIYHITKEMLIYDMPYQNLCLPMSSHVFEDAAKLIAYYGRFFACNEQGQKVFVLQSQPINPYYEHAYRYEGGLDLSFFQQYDCIVLCDVNEYSVELYNRALPLWQGKTILLASPAWNIFLPYLPQIPGKTVQTFDDIEDAKVYAREHFQKPLCISNFLPQNENLSRLENGSICYDEAMILIFMFSYTFCAGTKHPDKKFFLINGDFVIEGIFGIWSKVFCLAKYVKKRGYIPVFEIVSSDRNMYSDGDGDDIWNKFFLQPEGFTLEEVHQSASITVSPNANMLTILRHILSLESADIVLEWPNGIFNNAVLDIMRAQREKFLPDPQHTLGVLIRGTDYAKGNMRGHAIHATVEQMIEKIDYALKNWKHHYEYIYLATEDECICAQMKKHYGEMLICTDQERYTTQENQLLYELHNEKKSGEGFRLGVEYLATLHLLSKCESLIASGGCNGVTEALRQNENHYINVYVFNLGYRPN